MTYHTDHLVHIDASNSKLATAQLREILNLYEKTFSKYGDQFEPIKSIEQRLAVTNVVSDDFQPATHLLGYVDPVSNQIAGGLVFEFYRASCCGLLTYIFVNEKSKGLGSFLINQGMDWMLHGRLKLPIKAVFFETDNPNSFKNDPERLKLISRRGQFFRHKADAKMLDIPYVQPALADGQSRSYSLLLMTLPRFSANAMGVLMDKDVVKSFLIEFFNALDFGNRLIAKPYQDCRDDWDLLRISLSLDMEDIRENIDPFGLLNTPESITLHALHQKIWDDFLSESRREDVQHVIDADNEMDRILNTIPNQPDRYFFLKEISTCQAPRIGLKRCSVGLHIAELNEAVSVPKYCPFFHSYEKDLFAQRYQGQGSPYQSQCFFKGNVEVTFFQSLEFTSEGRLESLQLLDPISGTIGQDAEYTKPVVFFLNLTYFNQSRSVVWELVLNPGHGDDDYFTEFELIQLSKYFAGRQEKYLPQLRFRRLDDGKGTTSPAEQNKVDEIFAFLSENYERKRLHSTKKIRSQTLIVKSGSIQIETSQCRFITPDGLKKIDSDELRNQVKTHFGGDPRDFWDFFYETIEGFHSPASELAKIKFGQSYEKIPELEALLSTFCGFCTGIFDFGRLEFEEITDTMRPRIVSASETSFLIMNRAMIICFCRDDKLYEAVKENIGMSPYLLIPNSVLAHNSVIADKTEQAIFAEENLSEKKQGYFPRVWGNLLATIYERKSQLVSFINRKLDHETVANVFQFPTEQDIYQYGMSHQGINTVFQKAEKNKANIEQELDHISKLQSELFELKITLIFLILTFIQVAEVVGFSKGDRKLFFTIAFMSIAAVAYFFYRKINATFKVG